ncbi:MAG: hypothetical protein RI947_737 [Candidatus Parcubacteria bacterium]
MTGIIGGMRRTRFWIILTILLAAIVGGIYYYKSRTKPVHYHAGFRVYIDGKFQDFSGFKYMRISPCGKSENHRIGDKQIEKAHLHDGNGDVVHIHRKDPIWQDLFTNLKFTIPTSKNVVGYINGKKVNNILQQTIKSYDSVNIVIGTPVSNTDLRKNMVSKKRMQEVETQSEYCATGG